MWLTLKGRYEENNQFMHLTSDGWKSSNRHYFPLSPEGVSLVNQWQGVDYAHDQILSGVIADWLDEHRSELLEGATGPTSPARRLDSLIDHLRNHFRSHFEHST